MGHLTALARLRIDSDGDADDEIQKTIGLPRALSSLVELRELALVQVNLPDLPVFVTGRLPTCRLGERGSCRAMA